MGEAYSRPVTHLAVPRVGGLNHVGVQGQGCNQSRPDTLNSKEILYCFSELENHSVIWHASCIPQTLGKGDSHISRSHHIQWRSVMKDRAADRRKQIAHVAHLKLSGVLAVGGPFKSDGISWLQLFRHLCE